MSFVPANQNWWCNDCLAATEGEAPAGLAGPTADQVAGQRHQASHSPIAEAGAANSSFWGELFDVAHLIPLLVLIGGGLLIYSGSLWLGGFLVAGVFIGGFVLD
jgi:hypothetical protein